MYGLNHRLGGQTQTSEDSAPRGTVLVVDCDPVTIELARKAVAGSYDLLVAADAAEAMPLLRAHIADAVVVDIAQPGDCVDLVADAIASDDHPDVAPLVLLDHSEAVNAADIRGRVDQAMRVGRRGYLGGGLRQRMAA
jgi:CheY-like chemotaxis protein